MLHLFFKCSTLKVIFASDKKNNMENNYNDLNKFKATKKNIRKKIEGNVLIPIYYYIDDDGTVHIDTR